MSLVVWLPLTKDLRQQGLSNVTATNNGATFNSAGKLGGCYSFDGSNDNLAYTPNVDGLETFSIALWLCPNASTPTGAFFSLERDTYWQVTFNGANVGIRDNSIGWNGTRKNYSSGTYTANVWTHLVVTYNKGILKIYRDGNLLNTNTVGGTKLNTGINNARVGSAVQDGYYYAGKINDVRFYDHCLSQMEVKELAKGLILHYPLNRQGWGQENLLKNSNFLQGTNGMQGYMATSATCTKQTDCMKVVSTSASGGFYTSNFNSITTGDMTTFSADVKANSNMTIYIGTDGSGNGSCQAYTVGTSWQRISISKAKTTNNANLRIYGNGTFYAKNLKYELGSIATPWCPNSSDALATTMGLNSTTEYDSSGFGNNGTRTGTFSWTSNTPKYVVSQVFNGIDNAIQTPSLPTMISDKNYTVACWTYKTVIGTKNYQTIYGGPSGFELEARSSSSTSPLYRIHNWGGGTTAYNFGEWTHFCFVHTDSDSKLYVNGELKITGTSVNIPSGNYFVGAWNTSTQQNFEGSMSDFRIYATALSADDVKSLYQNSAYIDSSGNVYGAVHEEV